MITPFQSNLPWGRGRTLAVGRYYAAVIEQIRERGMEAALEFIDTMGGSNQRHGIAEGLVAGVAKIGDVASHRVDRSSHRVPGSDAVIVQRTVSRPHLSWGLHEGRLVGTVTWEPMFDLLPMFDISSRRHRLPG